MNKQELIERYESYEGIRDAPEAEAARKYFLRDLKQLDDPHPGHAEEAPRYVKNVLARLRELPLHDREVWLKAIMSEFERDFSHSKWREGYEQGKFEGMIEREKVIVPRFVANWYEKNKDYFEFNVWDWIAFRNDPEKLENKEFNNWINDGEDNPIQTLVNMHQFGYEVEKEKRYKVKIKGVNEECDYLVFGELSNTWKFRALNEFGELKKHHTRKELEEANFGWVFDCPGIEIEEVDDDQ